jgi:integrase
MDDSLGSCEINCTNLLELVGTFVRNSLAPNTLRAYASDLAMYIQWGGSLPASPQLIAAFLAAHARSHASSTLSRCLAAIAKVHRVRSWPDPTSSELVRATMRGIRRSGLEVRESTIAKALLRDDLFKVLDAIGSSVVDCRDSALLMVGFAGALRRSELVGLDVRDLEAAPRGVVITLRRSKTDQLNEGHQLAIQHGQNKHCPVKALETWLARSAIAAGPLFRPVNKAGNVSQRRLSGEAVSIIIKRRLAAAGIDPAGYSGHSLRAGFATSAAIEGSPLWKVRMQTRHATDQGVARYVRSSGLFDHDAAVKII